MPTGTNLTQAQIDYFVEGYNQGIAVKTMAHHLGVHYHTLNNLRVRLGMKPRREFDGRSVSPTLYLTEALHKEAKRRAREKGASLNQYIVGLIRRDVGFNLPIRPMPTKTTIANQDIKSELEKRFA